MPDDGALPTPSDRIVTIPNLLSLVRLALIPLFLGFLLTEQDLAALATLIAASVTDFLDGYLARRLNQVTRLGAILDPIVDRLCIVAAVLGLAFRGILPWWLVLVVFARDVALLVVAGVLAAHNVPIVPVSRVGKLATALLLAALPVLVCAAAVPATSAALLPVGLVLSVIGATLYWAAGIGYALATRALIREQRSDTPMPSVTLAKHEEAPDGR
jgi:cardiolipin synthase